MKLTKRTIDALEPKRDRYTAWDDGLSGFGMRVEASGRKTFLCRYRSGGVRRQYTIGRYGALTAEEARAEARRILGAVALGDDPTSARMKERSAIKLAQLIETFLAEHGPKLKPRSRYDYANALNRHVVPVLGHLPAEALTVGDLNKVHLKLGDRPCRAKRIMTYLGSVYSWAARHGHVPKGCNPARDVKRFRESGRERFLTAEELERLGTTLRLAKTDGLPWAIKASAATAKHVPKAIPQTIIYPPHVTGAIRLLLFTGCRLGEILNLRWDEVDLERGLLLLPDSKTDRKAVILNGAAIAVLTSLQRIGRYVVPGTDADRPRHDLKRPWDHIRSHARLDAVRLHDLRHTHASIGASAGFGLPIVGRLLGHASTTTTQRYAHLADDPLRRASEAIGVHLKQALEVAQPKPQSSLVPAGGS